MGAVCTEENVQESLFEVTVCDFKFIGMVSDGNGGVRGRVNGSPHAGVIDAGGVTGYASTRNDEDVDPFRNLTEQLLLGSLGEPFLRINQRFGREGPSAVRVAAGFGNEAKVKG